MAIVVRMPEVLTGVTEAAIASWLVDAGQSVTIGQPLAEIETEKAVIEYTSEVEGTVMRLLVEEGASISIGDPIVLVGSPGDPGDAGLAVEVQASAEAGEEPAIPAPSESIVPPAVHSATDPEMLSVDEPRARRLATPIVRRLARERNIDLSQIAGSGPNGRIVRRDLEALRTIRSEPLSPRPTAAPEPATPKAAAPAAAPSRAPVEEIPITPMRRAIARRLTESKTTVPHFYLRADCRVDPLMALRREVNEASDLRVSINDFVIAATAQALRAVPEANATWGDTVIRRHEDIDIAIAVAIDGGLVTPVLRNADGLRLTEISQSVSDLAGRARQGRLRQPELEGGTFSISNLGMYGAEEFAAIINPPHAGILAVGSTRPAPVVIDGLVAVGTLMTVTLSADHRVMDGAIAARWLSAFVERIEHPLGLLI